VPGSTGRRAAAGAGEEGTEVEVIPEGSVPEHSRS